jgi:hypothetical protein
MGGAGVPVATYIIALIGYSNERALTHGNPDNLDVPFLVGMVTKAQGRIVRKTLNEGLCGGKVVVSLMRRNGLPLLISTTLVLKWVTRNAVEGITFDDR